MIRCARCGGTKARDEFPPLKGRRGSGLHSWCRPCLSAYNRDRRPMLREYQRAWYAEHRDRKAQYRGRPEVRAREKARLAATHAQNPEATHARKMIRRARLAGVPTESIYRAKVLASHGGLCGICRGPVDPTDWHLDHILPICRGGSHTYDNVQPSHPFCNLSKGRNLN